MHHVTILLGLYNGSRWLTDQLESFVAQQGVSWRLIASDDGSTDDTREIVSRFGERFDIILRDGPRRGPGQNFLHLLRLADPDSSFAALSDQDDVWMPDKLSRAIGKLSALPADRPALYAGRTVICDEALRRTGLSPLFARPPSFRNALVQSIGGGNTMVLNKAALKLVQGASREPDEIVLHDWWLYQVISGAGGTVIYDAEPKLLYRQHGGNEIGSNASWRARMTRARMVAAGRLKHWNTINLAALRASAHRLTIENQAVLERFAEARQAPLFRRVSLFKDLGLYRQTAKGNASYWAAAAAGLI